MLFIVSFISITAVCPIQCLSNTIFSQKSERTPNKYLIVLWQFTCICIILILAYKKKKKRLLQQPFWKAAT